MKRALLCFVMFVSGAILSAGQAIAGSQSAAMNILPTPKSIELTGKKLALNANGKPVAVIIAANNDRNAVAAAQEINNRIIALGGRPLPVRSDVENETRSSGMNIINLTCPKGNSSAHITDEVREAMTALTSRGDQAYAIRFSEVGEDRPSVLLCGVGWQGLLYASSTFRSLIKRESGTISAIQAQIMDWPDFKNRGLPVWPLPASYDGFRRYVDWALQHKFNRIYTNATRKNEADGYNLPTREERVYLKKIDKYARERGIVITYALNWAVGSASSDRNKADYEGTVTFNNHYYTWSDDRLLKKRAIEIARFARETDAESLNLHCIDTYEENWDKRGAKDRERYGNDRSVADANVINIFTEEIRKINPGIELQFVVYPYHANFDLKGNEQYRTWMQRLTALISKDVYLVVTEFNRDQMDSWVNVVRQPLIHWINGNAFQWGRYFSAYPAFTKTAYAVGRDRDIIINMEPIGYFNGEVMQLVASEYAWNVDASGSGYIMEDRTGKIGITGGNLHYRQETVNGRDVNSFGWYNGTTEPEQAAGHLLLKACRVEFGEEAAPYMVEFFRNNPVGWRSASLYGQVLHDVMAEKELDASHDQLREAENALSSLKKALNVTKMDSSVMERLKSFLKNTYKQNLVISATTTHYQAKQLSMKGLSAEASEAIRNGRNRLVEIRREMEKSGYWSGESQEWYDEGESRLKTAETGAGKGFVGNLLRNPGFEEPLGPVGRGNKTVPRWSSSGYLALTEESHSGRYAANLKLKPSDEFVLMEQPFNVAPECTCYVEFWLKKDAGFRVIPIIRYWDASHTGKVEASAVNDFPFGTVVRDYVNFSGVLKFPSHAKEASFKLYADWYGFTPSQEKVLYIDDVFVGCVSKD